MGIWYATRGRVKGALDSKLTARDDDQVDQAIETASRYAERLCNRANFYPLLATRYFDWPDENTRGVRPWRLRLGRHTLISLTSFTAGGTAVAVGDLNLEPRNDGPPFRRIECDLSTSASFSAGDTHQQSLVAVGLWGENDDSRPAGALAAALTDTTGTTVDVTDSSSVDVGTLLRVDVERLNVTARALLTSGQTLGTNLAADDTADIVNLTLGTAFHVGEVLTLNSERMLLVDIAGNNGHVKRAWDGSRLAAHTAGDTLFVPRRLTVERAAAGTTATTHLIAASLTLWPPPPGIEALVAGEAVAQVENEQAGYARTIGEGEGQREFAGKTIGQLRKDAKATYGRNLRVGAV